MGYVLFPVEVVGRTDGDVHYIDVPKLARLYGVDYKMCSVVYRDRESSIRGYIPNPDDIMFYPKWDGDYSLP